MGHDDTIYALASGTPPSGIAVVRVSGPDAARVGVELTGREPPTGMSGPVALRAADGALIDHGLVLFFRGPRSFTGEDVLELQVHGSRAVVETVLERLGALGLRHAEAGEFTRRAFENGRMDLTEIEGLSDLLAAQTEVQRRAALVQQGGALRRLYEDWAGRVLHARAMIEAELDFADEDDVPDDAGSGMGQPIAVLESEMRDHLAHGRDGEIVREGFRIALLGPPNAGKSSLLNALVEREAAIVTDVPGTTRDLIEVTLQRGDMLLVVTDTAGLRETDDLVEAEGIRRARDAADRADLRIWLSPDAAAAPFDSEPFVSKDDAGTAETRSISVRRADGLDAFWAVVDERLRPFEGIGGEAVVWPTRARHREGVREAADQLAFASRADALELRAEHLRAAHHALARITGRVDVEDLLGVIFAEFCVGK